eukprot:Hpha_TRINITY_DN36830_c0_g1::TRINITY_DN36830_c0_g1_i1::g.139768::m.139768
MESKVIDELSDQLSDEELLTLARKGFTITHTLPQPRPWDRGGAAAGALTLRRGEVVRTSGSRTSARQTGHKWLFLNHSRRPGGSKRCPQCNSATTCPGLSLS